MTESMSKAFSIVAQAIARQFSVEVDSVTPATVALDVEGWDSFSNGLLIMAIEDTVGRSLPFNELAEADNVGDMAQVIARHI
jgi:acyl carrier protein